MPRRRPPSAAPRAPPRATCSSAASGSSRRNSFDGDRLAAGREHAHRAAGRRGQRAHHLVEPALLEHEPLEPLVDRDAALEHLVLLVHQPRERLLGDRDERQLVGHLEHREAERGRLLDERVAAARRGRSRCRSRARPGGGSDSSRTNSRWRSLACRAGCPVVSSSSPPDSQGVGSGSSEMCTQRTGASAPSSPAASSRPISATRPRTVSMRPHVRLRAASVADDPLPGLGEHRAQDAVDQLELLGVGDQRRRELDHGVAAVVGAADQARACRARRT